MFCNFRLNVFPGELLPDQEVGGGGSWFHGDETVDELLALDLPAASYGLRVQA